MGDTVIKWISDLTIWIGSITVLPGESGFRATIKTMIRRLHPAYVGPLPIASSSCRSCSQR